MACDNQKPDRSIRVLFFSTFVSRESGASHALLQTVKRVSAEGIEPLIAIPDSKESREMFSKSGFEVVYLPIRRPMRTWNLVTQAKYFAAFPATFFSLREIIRKRDLNLVHFNEITDFIGGIAAKSCGLPSVCHVRHDGIPKPLRRLLLEVLKRTADAIIVPSKSTALWITSDSNALSERVRLVYDYAFDMNEYHPSVSGEEFRREVGIGPEITLVVLVSKLVALKGHECFIRAAESVLRVASNVKFVIVGAEVPGHESEASAMKLLARDLIPSGRLIFVGARSDLPKIYAACDIAVHCPVYPDTYPTVVLLPMLMGKAVIGSRIGGIPEQIQHSKTGLLVPANDFAGLAAAILDLHANLTKRQRLGHTAMRLIREDSAPEKQGRMLAEIYREVFRRRAICAGHSLMAQ